MAKPKRSFPIFRALIIFLAVIPVALGMAACLYRYLTGDREQAIVILLPVFTVATMLGVASFASLFIVRKVHFVLAVLFLGNLVFMMVVNITSEILAGRNYGLNRGDCQ